MRWTLLRAALVVGLGMFAMTPRTSVAASASGCAICYQASSCSVAVIIEACCEYCSGQIGEAVACWNNTGGACPSGYVYIECDYRET